MVYANDPKAIRDAEKELADQKYQEQIDALDKMVERLEKYKELWDKIPDSYEKAQKKLVAADLFGPDWEDKILNLDMDLYNNFTPNYADAEQNMRDAAAEAAKYAVDDAAGKIVEAIKDLGTPFGVQKKNGYTLRDSDNNEYGFFDSWEAADLARSSLGELGKSFEIDKYEAATNQISLLNQSLVDLKNTAGDYYSNNLDELSKIAEQNAKDNEAITTEDIRGYYSAGFTLSDLNGNSFGFFKSKEEAEEYANILSFFGEALHVMATNASELDAVLANDRLAEVSKDISTAYDNLKNSYETDNWSQAILDMHNTLNSIEGIDVEKARLMMSKFIEAVKESAGEIDTTQSKADLATQEMGEDFGEVSETIDGEEGITSSLEAATDELTNFYDYATAHSQEVQDALRVALVNPSMEAVKALAAIAGIVSGMDAIELGKITTSYINAAMKSFGISGNAYASGHNNNMALTGELGEELVVHPNGTYETVGTNGAEFAKIGSNDIVFDHKQTKQLLENGHINSRGKAYAQGKFTPLSNLSGGNFDLYKSLNIIADNIPDIKNSITKLVGKVTSPAFAGNNSSPTITVNNPTFTCPGVTSEEVMKSIQNSFTGLLNNAYQQVMK